MSIRKIAVLLAALAFAGVACASDTPQQQQGQPENGGDQVENARFCDAAVETESGAVGGTPPQELEPLVAEMEATAPEEIAGDVEILAETIRAAADDPAAFEAPGFSEADEAIDGYLLANCGYDTVDVAGVEYAFEGVPAELPAGRTGFNFTNEGEELHEMIVFRLEEDAPSLDELLQMPQQEAEAFLTFKGAAFGPPGETDAEVIELEAGRYAMVCFISVGTTSEESRAEGPPHFTEGMQAELTVA